MVSREQVVDLYRLILDREPESDAVINEKRKADSVRKLAFDMLQSDEFFANNRDCIRLHLSAE